MSIKILLLSSDEELFQNIEKVFANHIERGFFVIYSPKYVENSPIKITYDLILTEEKYLSLIPVKHLPIIVLNSTGANTDEKDKTPNIIYTENPVKLEDLYDIILSLQYKFSSAHLSTVSEPIIKNYTNSISSEDIHLNLNTKIDEIDTYTADFADDRINIVDIIEDKSMPVYVNPVVNEMSNNNNNIFESNYKKTTSKDNYEKENHELITKFYNLQDVQKITKILNNYGEENKIDDKIIAQASIILDELLYTLQNLENIDLKTKEPKILMTIKNYNKEFQMNIQCLVPLEDKIQNIIGIAQDYGNMIQSFKRNNSYFLNINWYL